MKFKTQKTACIALLTVLSAIILGGAFHFVLAGNSDSYFPLAPLPGTTDSKGSVNLNTYIPAVFNLTIGIAGVLAVIMIIIGGVEYMTTDAIGGKSDAKGRISNALLGLLLVLISWILLHTINPKLTIFDLSVDDVNVRQETKQLDTAKIDTSNPYENKGKSATDFEQPSGRSVDKFKN